MSKILLINDIKEDKTAGLKARVDVQKILKGLDYETEYFPLFKSLRVMRQLWATLAGKVKKGDHLVIEFPVWHKRRLYLIKAFARLHGVKMYAIIHDISSIRFQVSPRKDILSLNLFDGVVSHNHTFTKWLRDNRYKGKIADLNLFDYLLKADIPLIADAFTGPFKLLYAGNLTFAKAAYIYDPAIAGFTHFQLHVYGQYLEEARLTQKGVVYKGAFDPDRPVFDTFYHFGLIWEGTSISTCEGEYGHYIRYNNPHKLSLYLSLGLPVAVWKEAAVADFVLKHQVGIVIGSLAELDTRLAGLTAAEYLRFAENAKKIAPEVRTGKFLQQAMATLTAA